MKFIKTAIAAVIVSAAAIAAAGPAQASTTGCTSGALTGYCGTQVNAETVPLVFDVYQQKASVNNKIIGYANSDTDKATDFFQYAYDGGTAKVFMYAPNGVPADLCVSEPYNLAGLVLRPCNGSRFQQFTAKQVGSSTFYTWTNGATGDLVSANGPRGQLTGMAAPVAVAPAVPVIPVSAQWSFAG